MKRKYLFFTLITIAVIISSCQSKKHSDADAKVNTDISVSLEKNKELQNTDSTVNTYEKGNKITPIIDDANGWSTDLLKNGSLTVDLNRDGKDDTIKIIYVEREGSPYIAEFEVTIAGSESTFKLEEYDAAFEKLALFDFDADNRNELIIMFDTHGSGGQGTHDIYILWLNSAKVLAKKINSTVEKSADPESGWNMDGIYDIEKVQYNGVEKMLVRQYVWGEDGHTDVIGDMVSIVSLNEGKNSFAAEEFWIEKIE